jgi:hypothetical protein
MEKGWGAEVPCADVQQGEVQYYVQGFNAANDPVATSGDRNNPYKTVVKKEAVAEAPHFPGKEPSAQCQDTGDCPPDFPGCKKPPVVEGGTTGTRGEGEDCEEDAQCESSSCKDSKCAAPASGGWRKFWVGVGGQLDFVSLPSATDVCLLSTSATSSAPVNSSGYVCTNSDGSDYPKRPSAGDNGAENANIVPGVSDKVQGGFAPANIRAFVTLDYAPLPILMLGARVGYVINTYPGSAGSAFAPVHLEARGTFLIRKNALALTGLAPYVFLGGGVAEWDAQVGVTVAQKTGAAKSVQAWNISGPGFAAAGGGLRYAFSQRAALMFGLRANLAFGSSTLLSGSPDASVQFGF